MWRWIVVGLAALSIMRPKPVGAIMMVKDGVDYDYDNIRKEMLPVVVAVERAWFSFGYTPMLTSYRRPESIGSLHAVGLAMDFRTFDLPAYIRHNIGKMVSSFLGPSYRVILEEGRSRWIWRGGLFVSDRHDALDVAPHLHVEYRGIG